jgi:hypothetical protein
LNIKLLEENVWEYFFDLGNVKISSTTQKQKAKTWEAKKP